MTFLQTALDISVRVLALGAVAGVGLWIFRVRSASLKHAVWMVVMIGMLVGAAFAPVLPTIPLRVLRAEPTFKPMASLPFTPVYRTAPEPTVRKVEPQVWWLWICAAISAALLTRLAVGYHGLRRLVRGSVAVRGDAIRESAEIVVPMTAGVLRPVILLPTGWREWSSDKLEAVLAHERAHIDRRDWAVMLLARINRSLFWFHPLAWWLERKLAVLAEEACDDVALAQVVDRGVYAQALLDIAGGLHHGRVLTEGVAMARTRNVESRIDRVLDESRRLSKGIGRAAFGGLAMFGAPLLYLTWAIQLAPAQSKTVPSIPVVTIMQSRPQPALQPAAPQSEGVRKSSPARTLENAVPLDERHAQWLSEVEYIITEGDRAGLLLRDTAEERDLYIERFWERRDPTPGSPENKFKTEHYRRIAYANERFASTVLKGWRTDRGRIYVTFGPPDEIESHPSAGNSPSGPTVPFEVWMYRHIDGAGDHPVLLTFTDISLNGDYRLVSSAGLQGRPPDLSIQVNAERKTVLTLPLEVGAGPFNILFTLGLEDSRSFMVFKNDGVRGPFHVQRFGRLPSGTYRVRVRTTNVSTGQESTSERRFKVD